MAEKQLEVRTKRLRLEGGSGSQVSVCKDSMGAWGPPTIIGSVGSGFCKWLSMCELRCCDFSAKVGRAYGGHFDSGWRIVGNRTSGHRVEGQNRARRVQVMP